MALALQLTPRMKMWLALAGLLVGASSAQAGPATWCKGGTFDTPNLHELGSDNPARVIRGYVAAECNPTDEVEQQRASIEKARGEWSKKLGMTEGDWADAAAWTAKSTSDDQYKAEPATKDLAAMSPVDQWQTIEDGRTDAFYLADVFEPKLSEAGRLALLRWCDKAIGGKEIVWTVCEADHARFDPDKLAAELRADPHAGEVKQKIRMQAYAFARDEKDRAARLAKVIGSDPVWPKAIEIAGEARDEWKGNAAKLDKYVAATTAMESAWLAKSRAMFEGCDAKTYPLLADATSELPAKAFAKMHDIRDDPYHGFAKAALPLVMTDPLAHIAAIGVVLCGQRKGVAQGLAAALSGTSSLRGPRGLAMKKLTEANLQMDRTDQRIAWPELRHPYRSFANLDSIGAVIKSVKRDGDQLIVTPAPLMVATEDCVQEHAAKQISRIRDDGKVEYDLICDKWSTRKHDMAWPPLKVRIEYEKVLKPGQMISVVNADNGAYDVIAIWPSGSAKQPSWVLGGSVK